MKGVEPSFDDRELDDLFAGQESGGASPEPENEVSPSEPDERLEALLGAAQQAGGQAGGPVVPKPDEPAPVTAEDHTATSPQPPRLAVLLAALALTLAMVAGVVALSLQGRIHDLNGQLTELQGRLARLAANGTASSGPETQATPAAVADELQRLAQGLDRLAERIDTGESGTEAEETLAALSTRVEQLEAQQGESADTAGGSRTAAEAEPLVLPASDAGAATAESQEAARHGWVVNLLAVGSADKADEQITRLAALGIEAYREQVSEGGRHWYRLRVGGFASAEEARAFAHNEALAAGYHGAWIAELP